LVVRRYWVWFSLKKELAITHISVDPTGFPTLLTRLNMRLVILVFLLLSICLPSFAQGSGNPPSLPNIRYHLTARPWEPLNTSKTVYLDKVEGMVRYMAQYQNSSGAIIDPYAGYEVQYATPYFAYALGTLISVGRATDLLNKGVMAMNSATADVAAGKDSIPQEHGEFFLAPLASALPLYAPHVSSSQMQTWRTRLGEPIGNVILGARQNWRTYAMKGEWFRAVEGVVSKSGARSWIESSWDDTQRVRFTGNTWNLYHDNTSDPDTFPYEAVARMNLLAMIAAGYDGSSRSEMENFLKKGTQTSLAMLEPSGQAPAGGRSGNHTWNDIVTGNAFETMAEMALAQGNTRLAGQYRRAATLTLHSVERWRRSNGSYSVTKNHFDPAARIRHADYSWVSNYNGYLMYHMAENYNRRKSNIAEEAIPAEIGGYTLLTDSGFAAAFANAGGMHMQASLRGSTTLSRDLYWTALGVVRFGRVGWDSRLGPSDGVRETSSKQGVSFAPTFQENGNWIRLASVPDRYQGSFSTQFVHPLLVRCAIEYKPKSGQSGPTFRNEFIITPDAILSTITSSSSNFGVTWPVLTYDGRTNLSTNVSSHIASVSYPGNTDEQNFIALHSSPTISTSDATRRSSYGDLRPVRMVASGSSNQTLIYPRSAGDPSAESVRTSFSRSGNDFSSILGRVRGNTYVGRTAAGGEGTSIDLNFDGNADATFSTSCGFLMQLDNGAVKAIEADRDVTVVVQGKNLVLKAYTPVNVNGTAPTPTPVVPTPTPATPTPTPIAGCQVASGGSGWVNNSFDAQTGTFTAEFDAIPSTSPSDMLVGLSNGAQTSYAGLAAIVRFNTAGNIDARNGGAYAAASAIPYSANTTYHFRLVVNVPARTYSAYVTPAGGSEIAVGENFAFRSEQASVSQLNNYSAYVTGSGASLQVCNFTLDTPSSALIDENCSTVSNFTTVSGGTWGSTNGQCALTAAATSCTGPLCNILTHNTNVSGDFTLTANASAVASSSIWDDVAIVFNYQDANNYYYAIFNESDDANTNALFKVQGGTVTQLADFGTTVTAPGTTLHSIRIERAGGNIQVYRGSISIGTASDSTFTSGKVGFASFNNNATFDNLKVTK
jgi:hypothetical protein